MNENEKMGLKSMDSLEELEVLVYEVLKENDQAIEDYRKDSKDTDAPVSLQSNQTDDEKEKEGFKEQIFAAPNFYQSSDISVMITNTHRSTRHGEDGIHDLRRQGALGPGQESP